MRRATPLRLIPAIVLALSACTGQPTSGSDGAAPVIAADGSPVVSVLVTDDVTVLSYSVEQLGGMQARSEGELAVVGDDCLGVRTPGGDINVVWPSGTTVASDGLSITTPDSGVIELGEQVVLAGGFSSIPTPARDDPAAGCSSGETMYSSAVDRA